MLGRYQDLTRQVTTETYANGFYIVAIMAVIGMVVAVFMRSGKKQGRSGHGPVEL